MHQNNGTVHPVISLRFNPYMNQQLLEKEPKYSQNKTKDNFLNGGHRMPTTRLLILTLFAVSISTLLAVNKNEWDSKDSTGKSMKKALYTM